MSCFLLARDYVKPDFQCGELQMCALFQSLKKYLLCLCVLLIGSGFEEAGVSSHPV